MSSAAAEIKPKFACKACGKPFDPEEGQEICDDCQARRTMLWIIGVAVLLICFVLLPLMIQWLNPPVPPP
jgi:predicted nucleic acid-binding Zn ribbon protein